jgi:predicted ATPase
VIIESLKLMGWRSYDATGISLNSLKSINLIIGPNNSGKSNLSKYLYSVKSDFYGKLPSGGIAKLSINVDENQTWNWKKNDINSEITISNKNTPTSNSHHHKIKYTTSSHKVTLHCQHSVNEKMAFLKLRVGDKDLFEDTGKILHDINLNEYTDPTEDIDGYFDNSYYWKVFLDSLVFVDPIRHHARNSANQQDFYFDGAKIIEELNALNEDSSNRLKWLSYTSKLKIWLNDILLENITSIDISRKCGLRFEFDSGLLLLLEELGTGVSQIVMLLSYLWINKDAHLNVFLEEPEGNLHPDSVTKLVGIFEKDLSNHRFFITTHSPSLIDCINDNWAVFRIFKKDGASKISCNDNIIKYYETLDALGVKASQILQANTIIWVEGPSDRIYIKKFIDLYSDNMLKEGKDFSFLYFGGTNLASFTLFDDPDQSLINILSSSRRAVLIADSDCKSRTMRDDENFKKYLDDFTQRMDAAIKTTKGIDSSLEDYFKIWITDGREVENYIAKDLMFNTLIGADFIRHSIGKSRLKQDLELIITSASEFSFGPFDSFDSVISVAYAYKNGNGLDAAAQENIALSYANKKVSIARAVIDKLEKKHCNVLDLESKIKELIVFIR